MSAESGDSSIDCSMTLVVVCRRPVEGVGKRRIAASLGDVRTLELARHLLATTLEDARAWAGPVVISPSSADDAAWAADLMPGHAKVIPQVHGNLGERINTIDSVVRDTGQSPLLYVGSDAPVLAPRAYERARDALTRADVVLGTADDGGVTLMGARQPWPDLSALPWSAKRLGNALAVACREAGLTVESFDAGYDIDRAADLERLAIDLDNDSRPARQALQSWLHDIGLSTPRTKISLVVPVLDDTDALQVLLEGVRRSPEQPFEIIVADASGRDGCRKVCENFGCIRLQTRAGRGHQLHAGAMRATGDAIWFLHADAAPPDDAIARIHDDLVAGNVGGFFRFSFAGPHAWHKSLLATLINLRCRFGIPYGDQGLFINRATYIETGGFDDAPLFEEVRFVRAARVAGRFIPVDATIGVSPRRWERDGWLRRTLHNRWLAFGHMVGVSPERLARRYRQPADKRTARC
jgi:rSAM/selenodomain-associated transferase 2